VQLAHTLRNLFARVGYTQVLWFQRAGMEEFLETTIEESPEKAGPDFLAGQTAEDPEFRGPVDEVFDLGTVDTEEEFSMLC